MYWSEEGTNLSKVINYQTTCWIKLKSNEIKSRKSFVDIMEKSPSYFDALPFSVVFYIIGKNDCMHGNTNWCLVLSGSVLFSIKGYYKVSFLVL